MNGPEHYIEAERILQGCTDEIGWSSGEKALLYQYAQVHATLALAAANAMRVFPIITDHEPVRVDGWREAES
jgi:hypothetical protein